MGGSQSAVLFLFCVIVSSLAQAFAASTVPALFVFGDSIVDSGNNVFVRNSTAVADFPPYGVDFFAATGRFTNARILTDVLGQLLGLPDWIPCNLAPTASGENILHGLNYASAGSGILDNTTTNVSSTVHYPVLQLKFVIGRSSRPRREESTKTPSLLFRNLKIQRKSFAI